MNRKTTVARYLFALAVLLLLGTACVRPAPRPENVQITEMPLVVTLVATPTPQLDVTAAATIDGGDSAPVAATTDPANSWPKAHEVVTGDTLSRISVIYGVPVEEIIAANSLTNPDALELGQVLTIPEPGSIDLTATTPAADPNATPQPGATSDADDAGEQVYIVQPGDTLFRIALAYGLTVDELAEYNDIVNVNALDVGQEIRIP